MISNLKRQGYIETVARLLNAENKINFYIACVRLGLISEVKCQDPSSKSWSGLGLPRIGSRLYLAPKGLVGILAHPTWILIKMTLDR